MIISEETDKLFSALSQFQAKLVPAKKSKQGHGYKYTDLAGCMDTARELLDECGLCVTQLIGFTDTENTLITVLGHESGQHIGSEFVMEKAVLHGGAKDNPAQKMGASITYMRRYAYAAILGIAQEDNDAADVKRPAPKRAAPRQQRTPPPPPPPPQNYTQDQQGNIEPPAPISTHQLKRLMVAYKGVPDQTRKVHASKIIGREISSFNELTKAEASTIIDRATQAEKQKNADT